MLNGLNEQDAIQGKTLALLFQEAIPLFSINSPSNNCIPFNKRGFCNDYLSICNNF